MSEMNKKLSERMKSNTIIYYGFTLTKAEYSTIFKSTYTDSNLHTSINEDDSDDEDELDDEDIITDQFHNLYFPKGFIDNNLKSLMIDFETQSYIRKESELIANNINENIIFIGIDVSYLKVTYNGIVEIPSVEYIISNFKEVDVLNVLVEKLKTDFNIDKQLKTFSYCNLNK